MYSPDSGHEALLAQKPLLAFDETKDFAAQKQQIGDKLRQLLGKMPEKVPLNPVVEYKKEEETYTEYRIRFDVEEHVQAICMLCIPKLGKEKYPLVLCIQGHTKGMQISMGRPYGDDPANECDEDFALQALERGYAALCLEQRGMGERRTMKLTDYRKTQPDDGLPRCAVTAMTALMLGRTMIGQRCWDISRAIDLALTFPEIDGDKIICTGNSGGGTATFYASCLDERIKVSMPSCAVCSFGESIQAMPHCACNYIPQISEYMDMGDMAAMIAPRKLVIIAGKEDPIFLYPGVLDVYGTIEKIYKSAGVPGNCALATGPRGHSYYKKEAWEAFEAVGGEEF